MLQSQVLGQDITRRTSRFFVGHRPPHIYLISRTRFFLLGLPPPFLHTASNQKLEAGTAWERGYRVCRYKDTTVARSSRSVAGRYLFYVDHQEDGSTPNHLVKRVKTETGSYKIADTSFVRHLDEEQACFKPFSHCQYPTGHTGVRFEDGNT